MGSTQGQEQCSNINMGRGGYDTTGVSKPNPPPKPKGKPDAGDLLGDVSQGISGPQQKHNIGGH
ncbi:hypothetical protein MGN70_003321 [Eutypa lata]|nr:hypothetical protein MGN70_003321 [Eutypa lata]